MRPAWSTRTYQPGDEQGILALWRQSFPDGEQRRTQLDYWRWQYLEGPAGPGAIRLAVSGDEIVGHAAAVPFRFVSKGEECLGCLSLDSMTRADFRGQGMFTRLERELYDDLAGRGARFIYGFPNENSIDVFLRKLQWKHLASLPLMARPLRLDRIAEKRCGVPFLRTLMAVAAGIPQRLFWRISPISSDRKNNLVWLDRFDDEAERLWSPLARDDAVFLKRDASFLNWRYVENPGRTYRILACQEETLRGLLVLREMEAFGLHGGMIMELQALPEEDEVMGLLLERALEHFMERRMDLVLCLTVPGSRLEKALRSKRFLAVPRGLGVKTWYFGGRGLPNLDRTELIEPIGSWHLTLGDTDII